MKKLTFKKITIILLILILINYFIIIIISWSNFKNNYYSNFRNKNNFRYQYDNKFNFQYGCSNKENKIINNKKNNSYFHTFFGDSKFTYSAYNEDKNGKPIFYGNRENLLNCVNDNPRLTSWRNQHINIQLILLNKKEISKYSDLKLSIENNDNDISINSGVFFWHILNLFRKQ